MKDSPRIKFTCLLGVIYLFTSSVVSATPKVEEFAKALIAAPEGHADLQGEALVEAYQKLFFQLSVDFPV